MKKSWIVLGLAGVCIVILSAWTVMKDPAVLSDVDAGIRIRNMGHELLLFSGDSTSRVLPVEKTGEGTYRLAFGSPFQFAPEALVEIAKRSLGAEHWQSYRVTVHDCHTGSTVYGFLQDFGTQMSVVPCVGRTYAQGCYAIQVSLQNPVPSTEVGFAWIALAIGGIFLGAFVMLRKKAPTAVEGISVGRYRFDSGRRVLVSNEGSTELSDKETRILDILLRSRDELVRRDQIMKEVWNDNGVLQSRSLDVFISRLRKKLSGDESIEIVNTHGVGYTLTARTR